MEVKKLMISGKANRDQSLDEIREPGRDLWLLGTDTRKGADKYFELHGIKVGHENTVYRLPDEGYEQGLPINNSISALLVYAWMLGYTDIAVVGAPMLATVEYQEQRPALAFVVGYLAGLGLKLSWDGMVENNDYGRNSQILS